MGYSSYPQDQLAKFDAWKISQREFLLGLEGVDRIDLEEALIRLDMVTVDEWERDNAHLAEEHHNRG